MICEEDAPVALKMANARILSRRLLRFEFIIPRTAAKVTMATISVVIASSDAKIGEIFDGASVLRKASTPGSKALISPITLSMLRGSFVMTTIMEVPPCKPIIRCATMCGMITE